MKENYPNKSEGKEVLARQTVKFSRGTVARSRQEALQSGLVMRNASSSGSLRDNAPSGVFFGQEPGVAEILAKMAAEQEGKIAVIVILEISAETLPLFKRRVRIVGNAGGLRDRYTYTPVKNFQELAKHKGEVTINLTGLSHEDLIALKAEVGFETTQYRQFEYKPYKTWAHELRARAKLKEGKRTKS